MYCRSQVCFRPKAFGTPKNKRLFRVGGVGGGGEAKIVSKLSCQTSSDKVYSQKECNKFGYFLMLSNYGILMYLKFWE